MKDEHQINAFIFDLGKVIVDWNPRYLLQEIAPDKDRLEYLVEVVLDLEWFSKVDSGYPLSKAIEERSQIYPGYAMEMQTYVDRWPETISGLFDKTLKIVHKLHSAGFPLYVLSNWADETWARVEGDFKFLDYFDDIIISGQVGMAKPDKAIFELARNRFGVSPDKTLFIDDTPKNVEAARAVGFQAVVFVSPDDLCRKLVALNVFKN
ncbi:MAG: Alpha-D-glucose 1-phosphate phosphatase YihX [Alphaproteobacteria bacterium MarineAlpha4_Bin2]|nr:MAG: Alpha-D-glucose 1-phosphate phosphatase YihX [Alphaproteobacteria bacterium MarineAlpha4_Bin2]|tara:strand:- start:50 stop:673 length:624 start_codon:yes stop_codon:yes gene_type:complete